MNYLGYFAKGGKTELSYEQKAEAAEFLNWCAGLPMFDGNSMDQIVNILNSDKELTARLSQEFQNAKLNSSQIFKCGGKLQQLTQRFAKGGSVDCGCGGIKLKGQDGTKLVSEDRTITIVNPFTTYADTLGKYSYPSTNGSFKFTPEGRTANVWDNTGGFATRYADENWIKNNPKKQRLPAILGGHRKLAPQDYWDNLIQRVNNRFQNVPRPTETLVITENPEGEGNVGHIQMEKCGNKIKKHQNGHLLIGENQAGYDGTDYVTTKNEPLLGKRYIGWSRKVVPGTKELDRSDMFGGLPEGMTHRFFRSVNGDTIKDTISPYGENAETANELNIAERLINNSDTLYWPNRERFNNLMKSSSTFASGRPQWILLDNERNKIK